MSDECLFLKISEQIIDNITFWSINRTLTPIFVSLSLQESFDPTMQLHLVHRAPCTIPPYISKNQSTLGDLLLGFLKYYATEFE